MCKIENHKSEKDPRILKYDRAGTTENLGKDKYSTNAVEIIGHPMGGGNEIGFLLLTSQKSTSDGLNT